MTPMSQTPDPTHPADADLTPPPGPPRHRAPGGPTGPPAAPSSSGGTDKAGNPLRASRTSGLYTAIIGFGIVLVLLIIFIVQNTQSRKVYFLSFEGSAPQAVLLLIALAAGIFLTAIASSLRLMQVRRRVKKEIKTHR